MGANLRADVIAVRHGLRKALAGALDVAAEPLRRPRDDEPERQIDRKAPETEPHVVIAQPIDPPRLT